MFMKSKYPKRRFYRQEKNEEFVDFFSGSSENAVEEPDKVQSQKKRIEDNFIPLIAEQAANEGQKIMVSVNRNEDIIESIDIECKCGCTTKIIIEYEK